jgi:hypothetical protein
VYLPRSARQIHRKIPHHADSQKTYLEKAKHFKTF